eukprot:2271611-Prymnesium_polylepis.1
MAPSLQCGTALCRANRAKEETRRKELRLPKYATPRCSTSSYGTDWGSHMLCERPSTPLPSRGNCTLCERPSTPLPSRGNCTLLSYGISDDCTFEVDVRRRLGCRVFGFDPTVTLPATIAP